MMESRPWPVLFALAAFASLYPSLIASSSKGLTFFEEKIRPVLIQECYKCHSDRFGKSKGGLQLDSRDALMRGGDSGPAIHPGNQADSLLIRGIRHTEDDFQMPPDEKLPASVIRDFEQWIQQGAPYPAPVAGRPDGLAWWDEAKASTLLRDDQSIATVIDHYVNSKLAAEEIDPAREAAETTLIRRVTLDLAGRIPTVGEVLAFLQGDPTLKWQRLVNRLLASPEFVSHQAGETGWFLAGKNDAEFRGYLTRAFEKGHSWAQIFRDVILAETGSESTKGADRFLKSGVRDLDRLTNDISVRFFGVNVSCAQCHDHPLVADWKQDHYFGMKSFLNRTFENGGFIVERAYGQVSFKTTRGESKMAHLRFLSGSAIDEPDSPEPSSEEKKAEKALIDKYKKEKQPLPPPSFSRRKQLVEAGLRPGQDGFFSRAIVNHLWDRFFGRGLVEPLDQLHSRNRPSHPELLLWLARDLVAHDYDLRRLMRGIVLSDAYRRSSRWASPGRPTAETFAVAEVRPLTPRQLAFSLRLGVEHPEKTDPSLPDELLRESIKKIEERAASSEHWFDRPADNFQVSSQEALLLSNNEKAFQEFVIKSGLVGHLRTLSNRRSQIVDAYWNILSRPPRPEEMTVMERYLDDRLDRPGTALEHMVWALLTNAENRFNY